MGSEIAYFGMGWFIGSAFTIAYFHKQKLIRTRKEWMAEQEKKELKIGPKGGHPRHYNLWSRKGTCPGCHVGTGSKHAVGCLFRHKLLAKI